MAGYICSIKMGFFFMNSDMESLKQVYTVLKDYHYNLESVHQADETTFVMQVSKTEILTPLKLHARNESFNQLQTSFISTVMMGGCRQTGQINRQVNDKINFIGIIGDFNPDSPSH